jgi:protoheme IX farnesyltransferase
LKANEFLKISNSSVTFIVFIVTVSGFFANPSSLLHLLKLIPLVVSGYLLSMAAVVFNNIYDRDIDGKMSRTEFRIPLINASRTWLKYFAVTSFTAGTVIIFLLVNYVSAAFLVLGFISYTFLYTMVLKRKTSLNIVIGGIAGSFAALSGWMAPSVVLGVLPVLIAVFVFAWMSLHFLVFSLIHNDDYMKTELPMLPAKKGISTAIKVISLNGGIVLVISVLPLLTGTRYFFDVYLWVAAVMGAILVLYILQLNVKEFSTRSVRPLLGYSVVYLVVMVFSFGIIRVLGR